MHIRSLFAGFALAVVAALSSLAFHFNAALERAWGIAFPIPDSPAPARSIVSKPVFAGLTDRMRIYAQRRLERAQRFSFDSVGAALAT